MRIISSPRFSSSANIDSGRAPPGGADDLACVEEAPAGPGAGGVIAAVGVGFGIAPLASAVDAGAWASCGTRTVWVGLTPAGLTDPGDGVGDAGWLPVSAKGALCAKPAGEADCVGLTVTVTGLLDAGGGIDGAGWPPVSAAGALCAKPAGEADCAG